MAGFRSLGGGEVLEMTRALYDSRQDVMARMVAEAEQRGANAIVAMRFDTSAIGHELDGDLRLRHSRFCHPAGRGMSPAPRASRST